jgi:hypothetical protein
MSFFRANLIGLKADRDKKEIGTRGYLHNPSGTGTAVHVRKILVRHLTLYMKDYGGTLGDWYSCGCGAHI